MEAPKGGAQKGGGPKISPFFFRLPSAILLFLSVSGCLLVEFWWCLKRRSPQKCAFRVLGLSCEARNWWRETVKKSANFGRSRGGEGSGGGWSGRGRSGPEGGPPEGVRGEGVLRKVVKPMTTPPTRTTTTNKHHTNHNNKRQTTTRNNNHTAKHTPPPTTTPNTNNHTHNQHQPQHNTKMDWL